MSADRERAKPRWQIIDTVVRGDVVVEVSELALKVPRFSFRVGTAYYPDNEDGQLKVGPRLTIFNAQEGYELLRDVVDKYVDIREARIQELEDRKSAIKENLQRNPEVSVRRSHSSED